MRASPLILLLIAFPVVAQSEALPSADPEIATVVAAVSADEIESTVRRLVDFGTRHTLSATDHPTRGIGAAREWLKARLQEISTAAGGRLQVAFDAHQVPPGPRVPEGAAVVNVVGTLPGTDANRFIILSGHYDSRASNPQDATSDAPGADDDASGAAVVVEAARVLAHLRPRATMVFLLTAGEEQGLLGAAGHAKALKAEGAEVVAMTTNDIVGGVQGSSGLREPDRVRLFSEGIPSGPKTPGGRPPQNQAGSDNDAPSRQLARYLAARAPVYVPGFEATLIFRQDRFLRGGDHRAFNDEGFPGVRFTEPHENYDWQHQDVRKEGDRRFGDLPENLDYGFIQRVAKVNIAGLLELALAPAAPREVRVVVANLTPHTELRWSASAEKDLAGYAIVYRRTHEPTWTHRVLVGREETRAVLERLSKDDWLFGVEAYDAKGRRSLPIYPRPSQR